MVLRTDGFHMRSHEITPISSGDSQKFPNFTQFLKLKSWLLTLATEVDVRTELINFIQVKHRVSELFLLHPTEITETTAGHCSTSRAQRGS